MKRTLLSLLGCLSFAAGFIGIFLPLLPTVPLWLLSAWCFARSSTRLHQWLLNHRQFGPVIKHWQNDRRIPRKIKIRAVGLIWLSLLFSMWLVEKWYLCLMLASIGCGVSIYLLFVMPTTTQED